jgi:molecular chaperone DnaJ
VKVKEAYDTLELSLGASPEEVKKKYRELTKKYHPDVNKDPDAEAHFKKINEAHQVIQTGKSTDLEDRHSSTYASPFHRQQQVIRLENVDLSLTVSFKESVLGCKKEVKYSRQAKCHQCDGAGDVRTNNGCKKCGGKGQTVTRQNGMVMITTCTDCFGRSELLECTLCKARGTIHTDVSVHVSVPAGVSDGSTLRLQGMGNYAGSFMGSFDQYTDAFCHITVIPEPGLSIDGKSVVSRLTISLLDALQGCQRTVKTIHGDKGIQINPSSKNGQEVIIPHYGVGGTGSQRVILDVDYPSDVNKLIDFLNKAT